MRCRTGFSLIWITTTIALAALAVAFSSAARTGPDRARDEIVRSRPAATLTVYCGRSESLVGDIIRAFERETGVRVRIKYGATGPLATMILEEGSRSHVDVFFAQDPGGLGLLARAERLATLPQSLLDRVEYHHRDPNGTWTGITGRLRTISYSTVRVSEDDLPQSILELTEAKWNGRIGWAPSNASFQAFITAMRHQLGEDATEHWLRAMRSNGRVRTYPNNASIVQAIADGEIDLGLTNHYYLHRFLAERGEDFPVRNHVPRGISTEGKTAGDVGGTMLIAGAAILESSQNKDAAHRFLEYLLGDQTQARFASSTFEYPLALGVAPHESVPSLSACSPYAVDLNELGDLERTVALLRRVGALE